MRISGITYVPRKNHNTRNIVFISIVFILLISFALMGISMYDAWQLVHPKKINTPPVSTNVVPTYRNITFYDKSKSEKLSGWYFEAKGSEKTIILAHGHGKNKLQFGNNSHNMIKEFINTGYNVLTFDFRGSGISTGSKSSFGNNEILDLLGAISYAKTVGSKYIVLMGFSTGASACLLAAEKDSLNGIDAIIADSAYANMNDYLNFILPSKTGLPAFPFNKTILFSMKLLGGVNPSDSNTVNAVLPFAPRPILFIQSKDDTSLPSNSARKLYNTYSEVAGANALIWETSGALNTESYYKYPTEYMSKVFEFLEKVYPKKK